MARPKKNNVEYFPHPVNHGKKMSYMEKKYGNDGYAVWFKLLEELGEADNHFLDLNDDIQVMFLSDKCLVDEEVLFNIISDLIKLREFDAELWESHKVLYNQNLVDSVSDAYKKRINEIIDKKSLLQLLQGLSTPKQSKSNRKPNKSNQKGCDNTQSKVKYSKVDKSKVKYSKINNTLMSKIKISDLDVFENSEGVKKHFEIAEAFRQLFIKNQEEKNSPTKNQENAKFKNYVDPVRLMMENDGVTKDQMVQVFEFLDSPKGEFWKSNILSTSKLRIKFNQLIMRANEKKQSKPSSGFEANEDYFKEVNQSDIAKSWN